MKSDKQASSPEPSQEFFLHPETIYERKDLEPREVFAVEEFYASLKYGQFLWQAGAPAAEDPELEEAIARAVDDLESDRNPQPEILPAAGAVLSSIRMMQSPGRAAVPEVLRNVVRRSLETQKQAPPSLVVRVLGDTLEVLKSSFQNVALQNSEALAVRSSATTAPRERTDKYELRQVVSVDLTIFYEILRENGNEVMLRIHLEPEPPHCRVNLLQNGRKVTSLNYVRGTGGITFQRLAAGSYKIEIKGDDWDFATGVEIEAE